MNRRKFFQFTAGAVALLTIPLPAAAKQIFLDGYTVEAGDSFYIMTPLDTKEPSELTIYDKEGDVKFGPVFQQSGEIKLPPRGIIERREEYRIL